MAKVLEPVKADKDMALAFLKELGFKFDAATSRNRENWFSVRSTEGFAPNRRQIDKLVAAGLLKSLRWHEKKWHTDSYEEGYGIRFNGRFSASRMIWLSYPGMRSEKITLVLSNNYRH